MMKAGILILTFLALLTVVSAQTPAAVERGLLSHLKEISKYGTYGGSYDGAKLSRANDQLRKELIQNGRRLVTLKYQFPKLKAEMFVTASNDGKLRVYSWDMQTGGTMHDYASVFQYQGNSGRVYAWTENDDDESAGAFYTQIFQVSSRSGPIYLVNSSFIASSSLSGQSLDVVRIVGEKLDRKSKLIRTKSGLSNTIYFAYDFFSVVDRPERPIKLFEFNEAKREFRFPVVIEDEATPQGRVTNKFITYRFNGNYFVKIN